MKLLIVTQTVDTEDPVLGFFVRWIEGLSKQFEHVEVIALKVGMFNFPKNVRVHSLGKERTREAAPGNAAGNTTIYGSISRRVIYAARFLRLVWKLRHDYDAVFVHMNQEYLLVAGWFWKLVGKSAYLWRNFHSGDLGTIVAAAFCRNTFCTSESSYTTRFQKNLIMPVGVDLSLFSPGQTSARPNTILSLGRIAPVKRLDTLVEALCLLAEKSVDFHTAIYGDALPKDIRYLRTLRDTVRERELDERVTFHEGIPALHAPDVYRAHQLFVNLSPSGMYDKTIYEAAACGCLVIASSDDFAAHMDPKLCFSEGNASELAGRIEAALVFPAEERARLKNLLQEEARRHSLGALVEQLVRAIH